MTTKYFLPDQPKLGVHVWNTANGSYFSMNNSDGWQRWFHCDCSPDALPPFHPPVNGFGDGLTWGQLLFAVGTVETFIPGEKVRATVHAPGETVNLLEALQRSEDKREETEKAWRAAVAMVSDAKEKLKAYQTHRTNILSFVTRLNELAPGMADETLRTNIRYLLNLIEKG